MQIGLLGSAPSSIQRAPFRDARYAAWVQGRVPSEAQPHATVPGDFELWGCSPGCWAQIPRATRWFEVHRWEPGQDWFSVEYCQFLRDFKGPVYTGGAIPEIPNHVVYPIDHIEEKFTSEFLTSSLALMLALAIDEIEQIREARAGRALLPRFAPKAELEKTDRDDVIGMWGVDMSADEEWSYQRPGCKFFLLEAMRRGIGVYVPPESDLMRPMPVYGISEWDHNYIKLTARARELNAAIAEKAKQAEEAKTQLAGLAGEMKALNYFVNTWTSPYGMLPGMVVRHEPGTGLGGGITHFDARPVSRMKLGPVPAETEASRNAVVREIGIGQEEARAEVAAR